MIIRKTHIIVKIINVLKYKAAYIAALNLFEPLVKNFVLIQDLKLFLLVNNYVGVDQ